MTTSTTTASVSEWATRFDDSIMRTMGHPLGFMSHGEGSYLWDIEGNRYLDFLSGIAVNALGHAHPVFVNAVAKQAATLSHVSNYFSTGPQLELSERLKRITGAGDAGRAYFCNSGAEAIEAALKLARLNSTPDSRTRVIAMHNAFHGRTMGALALTGKPHLRVGFEPLPGGVEHIDTTIEALEKSIDGAVAAVFVEVIKGEAGVVEVPEGFLKRARELTEEHGALLIIDEIQTGAGRTGEWFAYEHAGITPDAVTLAKGIGGGFPIGALVTFGWASDLFSRGQHGSTFGGNPLATAVANAVLGEIESAGLIENARLRGAELTAKIEALNSELIAEVRGRGLLLGLGLNEPVAVALSEAAMKEGLIINAPNESSIRLAPALNIGDAEVAEFLERFARALAATNDR